MSAPRRRKPRKTAITRREFLRRASAGAAALGVAPLLPGCDGSGTAGARQGSGGAVFRHGIASGDPLADRVILWTRISGASGATPVEYLVGTDPQLTQNVRTGTATAEPGRDYTVKVDATALLPGTTYYYRFRALGQDSPVGRTRTLPVGAVERLRLAVVSCSSYAHGFFNAYARVAERADLDAVLHLGDYIYEYGSDQYGSVRPYEPAGEIVTLEDYRTRHAYYRLDPDLQALHRQHPMICVWDDHESANDSWRDGAENHTAPDEGEWPVRKGLAQRVYDEWMPIRTADPARIQRQFVFGDLVDLLMLDTRLAGRDAPGAATLAVPGLPVGVFAQQGVFADESRQLLGADQEAWLAGRLAASTAVWKLLGQQVMFGQLKVAGTPNAVGASLYLNPDQWDGYDPARSRVFDMIEGVDNVVVLTGDIHTSWAMDLTRDPNNPVTALGGYNPLTGEGSLAVEFVGTSITSPGLPELAQVQDLVPVVNPHMKYVDLEQHGYLLLDITRERCQGEFWFVDTIAERGGTESFAAAYAAAAGSNRLAAGTMSEPRASAPALVP